MTGATTRPSLSWAPSSSKEGSGKSLIRHIRYFSSNSRLLPWLVLYELWLQGGALRHCSNLRSNLDRGQASRWDNFIVIHNNIIFSRQKSQDPSIPGSMWMKRMLVFIRWQKAASYWASIYTPSVPSTSPAQKAKVRQALCANGSSAPQVSRPACTLLHILWMCERDSGSTDVF